MAGASHSSLHKGTQAGHSYRSGVFLLDPLRIWPFTFMCYTDVGSVNFVSTQKYLAYQNSSAKLARLSRGPCSKPLDT